MKLEVYFGVPGAGKTYRLAKRVEELMSFGYRDVKVVSLANATKRAFKGKAEKFKLGLKDESIRTLHSFCFEKLKERGYSFWVDASKWFRKKGFKYDMEEVGEDWRAVESPGVVLHGLFDLLRLTWDGQTDFKKHCEAFVDIHADTIGECELPPHNFTKLFNEFMGYQLQKKKLDFTNMLFLAVQEGIELEGGDVLAVDEAQDFGPLHWFIIKRWMEKFKRVLIGGDDDQSIYGFAGAEPSYLLELTEKGKVEVLSKSFRVPEKVAELSNALISLNTQRYPKTLEPKGEEGVAFRLPLEELVRGVQILGPKGSILILARTRKRAVELSNMLGVIPHKLDIEGMKEVPKRLKLLWMWRAGKNLTNDEWMAVLKDPELFSMLVERLQARDRRDALVRVLLEGDAYELSRLFDYPVEHLERWLAMLEKPEAWAGANIRITTIHQAKGDEADYVFIDPAITPRIFRSMQEDEEAERRVWYVALTRARKGLLLLEGGSGLTYPLRREVKLGLAKKGRGKA